MRNAKQALDSSQGMPWEGHDTSVGHAHKHAHRDPLNLDDPRGNFVKGSKIRKNKASVFNTAFVSAEEQETVLDNYLKSKLGSAQLDVLTNNPDVHKIVISLRPDQIMINDLPLQMYVARREENIDFNITEDAKGAKIILGRHLNPRNENIFVLTCYPTDALITKYTTVPTLASHNIL